VITRATTIKHNTPDAVGDGCLGGQGSDGLGVVTLTVSFSRSGRFANVGMPPRGFARMFIIELNVNVFRWRRKHSCADALWCR